MIVYTVVKKNRQTKRIRLSRKSGPHVEPYSMLLHDFPIQYIEELRQPEGTIDSPLMQLWRKTREPVLVELERDWIGIALSYISRIRKYGFKNAAAHGLVDVLGDVSSFFCFVDIPEKLGGRHRYMLKVLVPHLHLALTRSVAATDGMARALQDQQELLTARQKEILGWIYRGKTNWEIGRILGLAEDTVKYHVTQILSRLCVTNRVEAVTKALRLKIIER